MKIERCQEKLTLLDFIRTEKPKLTKNRMPIRMLRSINKYFNEF